MIGHLLGICSTYDGHLSTDTEGSEKIRISEVSVIYDGHLPGVRATYNGNLPEVSGS